jgi:hypothetical protein
LIGSLAASQRARQALDHFRAAGLHLIHDRVVRGI